MKAKRLIAMLLCAMMLVSLLPAAVFAEEAEDVEIVEISFDAEGAAEEEILPEEPAQEAADPEEDELIPEESFEEALPEDGEIIVEKPAEDEEISGQPETEEDENAFDFSIIATGVCGENVEWSLYDTGELYLYGEGDMYNYPVERPSWNAYSDKIKSIYMDYGITTAGSLAFCKLPNLTEVNISDTANMICYGAFFQCPKLSAVTIPESVTAINEYAFGDCTSVSNIYFEGNCPEINPHSFAGVKADAWYYYGTTGWDGISYGYGGTINWKGRLGYYSGYCGENLQWTVNSDGLLTINGVGEMYDFFNEEEQPWKSINSYIVKITVKNGVTHIGSHAFDHFVSLESASLPESVTSMSYAAFLGCVKLSSVNIPKGITVIESSAFYNCAFTSIVLPEGLKAIKSSAFSRCKFTSVDIPAGVTEIGNNAFSYGNLTAVTIPAGVTKMGTAVFTGCKALSAINVNPANQYYKSVNGVLFTADGKDLLQYPAAKSGAYTIPGGTETVKTGAFSFCQSLTSVIIPASVKALEDTAFAECTKLANIKFLGNAPTFGNYVFSSVDADAAYPSGNATWTSAVMQSYFGQIRWKPYGNEAPVITTVANHADYMIISWNKVEGAVSYTLAYREGSGAWQSVAVSLLMVDSKGNPRVNLKNLKQGVNYTFIAYANFADGTQTKSASATQTRLLTPAVTAKANNGYVALSWNSVEGGSQYKIYYREKGGSWQLYAYVGKNVTSVNIKETIINANGWQPLIKGRTYEFAVLTATSVPGITSGFPTNPATVIY